MPAMGISSSVPAVRLRRTCVAIICQMGRGSVCVVYMTWHNSKRNSYWRPIKYKYISTFPIHRNQPNSFFFLFLSLCIVIISIFFFSDCANNIYLMMDHSRGCVYNNDWHRHSHGQSNKEPDRQTEPNRNHTHADREWNARGRRKKKNVFAPKCTQSSQSKFNQIYVWAEL